MATEPKPLSRILLIDDDAITREVLAMMLEMHGIAIDTAADGATALALLDAFKNHQDEPPLPVVILMDTQMPGLSGTALIEAIRQRSPARIIAISGSAVSDEIRRASDGFLLKPIEIESLVDLLEDQQNKETAPLKHAKQSSTAIRNADEPAAPEIDSLILGKFKAMMPASAVREIYVATALDLKPRIESLQAAMAAQDTVGVRRIAHAIKGGCAMVGLSRAAKAAAHLETSNGLETYPQELAELRSALNALEGILGDDFLR